MENLLAQLLVDGQRAPSPISAVVETKYRVQDTLKEATEAYMEVIQQKIASNMTQHNRHMPKGTFTFIIKSTKEKNGFYINSSIKCETVGSSAFRKKS